MSLSDDIRYLIEYDIFRVKRLLGEIVGVLPRSFDARILLGDTHLRALDFDGAITQYQAARQIAPQSRLPVAKLALCALYTGQNEEALRGFEILHESAPDEQSLTLAALMLHRLGRLDESVQRYRRVTATAAETSAYLSLALQGEIRALRARGLIAEADQQSRRLMQRVAPRPDAASELHRSAASYDFHEWSSVADKGRLSRLLAHAARHFGATFRFPAGFVLPEEREAFMAYAAAQPEGTIYIVKPRGGQGGQSIRLTDQPLMALEAEHAVVQRYVDRPYLVDGRKAHMRVYCLITSVDPLRFYIYNNGIVRFAPRPYERGDGWLDQADMHVTNTALHRNNPLLVISQDPAVENAGHVWSMRAYLRRIGADGHDPEAIFRSLAHLVGQFVLVLRDDGFFTRQLALGSDRSYGAKLFGFDVLLDADAQPWLIEVQRSPAWGGQPLAKRINGEVAATIARMVSGPLGGPEDVAIADEAALTAREAAVEGLNRGGFIRIAVGRPGV